jgi:hypothetical protein
VKMKPKAAASMMASTATFEPMSFQCSFSDLKQVPRSSLIGGFDIFNKKRLVCCAEATSCQSGSHVWNVG